jgi:hypothetical protein
LSEKQTLVEIKYLGIKFPSICPVCGQLTTTEGTIPAMTKLQRAQAKSLGSGSFPSSRAVATTRAIPEPSGPSYLTIPTCDAHAISFKDTMHFRPKLSALNGILIVSTVLLALFFLGSSLGSNTIDLQLLSATIFVGLGALLTYRISGPSALERSVLVYDMMSDMSTLVLRISNLSYAEELLKLNPMKATRVES